MATTAPGAKQIPTTLHVSSSFREATERAILAEPKSASPDSGTSDLKVGLEQTNQPDFAGRLRRTDVSGDEFW